jgi:hypothetical protein
MYDFFDVASEDVCYDSEKYNMPQYEIEVYNRWIVVNEWIWRSWAGHRRVDGQDYTGVIFYLGTEVVFE